MYGTDELPSAQFFAVVVQAQFHQSQPTQMFAHIGLIDEPSRQYPVHPVSCKCCQVWLPLCFCSHFTSPRSWKM